MTQATEVRACGDCLRRSWLLDRLGPFIEKSCANLPGSRTPDLLALGNLDLVDAVGGMKGGAILDDVREMSVSSMEETIVAADCWAVCRHDDAYPEGLRGQRDAPWALIGRGDSVQLEEVGVGNSVTVVGSRRASSYGLEVARSLSHELAASGLFVVSGMALGIDGAAHRGALECGPTIAVLGCGADRAYPVSHTRLYRKIVETGLVISEVPPGARAWRWSFPARNRIMAALSQLTVVVEAATRSGSLITAEMAIDSGRDVGAVPGLVTSGSAGGTNELIANGAALIRDGRDVIDRVFGVGAAAPVPKGPEIPEMARLVLATVESGSTTCEEVSVRLERDPGPVAAELARLEIAGYLNCSLFGQYTRTGLATPSDE